MSKGGDYLIIKHILFSTIAVFLVWALSNRGLTPFEVFVTLCISGLYYDKFFLNKK
jgi:hypothetical protein